MRDRAQLDEKRACRHLDLELIRSEALDAVLDVEPAEASTCASTDGARDKAAVPERPLVPKG
jgi:hypothetical protein